MGEDGFGTVYRSVMRHEKLGVGAKALYALLCSYSGAKEYCWPTVKVLCKDLGVLEPTLKRYRAELVEKGIIRVEPRRSGNRNGANIYRLYPSNSLPVEILRDEALDPLKKSGGEISTPSNISPHPVDSSGGENRPPENKHSSNINREKEHSFVHLLTKAVCTLFNQAKSRSMCKGRLKSSSGEWCIERLLDSGMTPEAIQAEAREYIQAVPPGIIQWWDFGDFATRTGKKWRNRSEPD